ncbi:uncharacterized protein Eint_041540 [Encephalitozoon intestinalis ATCC 50506]|uniref:Rab-GAP TBC domain-containing protein n=1 Tax=Encephalitozoon intestinalis (strain ATCC 50506) TaxID=876142 RepID=E0S6V6_ENCIT|nr:uncharacterized protein Eint_041540 [Encephalitozoon intestinalis ATCC 50506]ADM11441.1 hypothetical protein Eint_041540 [Encephalitozoon intestinalis ATCC 50506]UTX45137.1 GTP-binding protein YPT1 [Encephalitozoon intestinalis]
MVSSPDSKVFGENVIDEKLVRKLCFGGVRNKYRGVAWRILFQVVGLKKQFHREEVEVGHAKYAEMVARMGCSCQMGEYFYGGRDLNIDKSSLENLNKTKHHALKLPEKIVHQIDLDIKRIDLRYRTYLGVDISYMYYRVLWLIAYKRPLLGYIQGMADILVPFVFVFSHEDVERAESNAYFCYARLLDETQHNIMDLQTGMIKSLDFVLQMVDPDLHKFLKDIGLEIHMFAFRWFNCFFTREFKIPILLKVLDTIFSSDSINESLLYFGVALLMKFKPVLIENDFSHNILFLQSIYEQTWEEAEIELVLSSAKFYRKVTSKQLLWSRFWG